MPLIVFILLIISPLALSAICPRVDWDKSAIVKQINDGDTLTLDNGTLVRFIGINTPEINYRNLSQSAPYALQAKALVERYIKEGDKVNLVFDKTRRDKYGRLLAYVYSKTGQNIGSLQLQAGYGKQWVIGENDRFWRCFQEAERKARIRKKNMWSDFVPVQARKITKEHKGYQTISGQISEISKTNKGILFFLDRKLRVSISASKLKKFSDDNIDFRKHQRLLITGKIRFSDDLPTLRLYHPVQILP